MTNEKNSLRRPKFGALLKSDPCIPTINTHDETDAFLHRKSDAFSSTPPASPWTFVASPSAGDASPSPYSMSPWSQSSPYYSKSPWIRSSPLVPLDSSPDGLMGSLVREQGHVYSLAAAGRLLYTGSDSKNIWVWKDLKEYSGFKSNSGFVKAIVIAGDKIFTGHQDGKIRIWKFSPKNYRKPYRRVGSLPRTRDFIKSSLNPKNYVEVRRRRNVPWIKHFDAVSSMSLDEDQRLLYTGSWDKTVKVWRISDSKCLESIDAHDDAVNSVAAGFDGLLFTGSADGTVKVWRRELLGRTPTHVLVQILLKQEHAVTALAVNAGAGAVYCGSSDGLLNFWEREKRWLRHRGVLRGHKMAVLCVAAAGNLVFSGSADRSICVWRREAGGDHACLSVLAGHSGPIKCLAVEEDDNDDDDDDSWMVYSGSLDKSVKVWRVSEHARRD
ncbi:protein JINGUBANG-like [Diospyros lotus]|uniref:protein JINGUBANG-like n=1 Tax=Diospyros lotus TaxID=55363 RepID=UPI00225C0F55|nr:protein JINGUBANG-like [Diospyros lotus]